MHFFLEGVRLTAEGAVSTARRLSRMFQDHRDHIQDSCGRKAGSVLRVHDVLRQRTIVSLPVANRETQLTFRTVSLAMERLVALRMAREITGKRRNRLFVYDRYLATLNEGTEGPSQS